MALFGRPTSCQYRLSRLSVWQMWCCDAGSSRQILSFTCSCQVVLLFVAVVMWQGVLIFCNAPDGLGVVGQGLPWRDGPNLFTDAHNLVQGINGPCWAQRPNGPLVDPWSIVSLYIKPFWP